MGGTRTLACATVRIVRSVADSLPLLRVKNRHGVAEIHG
jgi:hypothetical protein